MKDIMTPGRSTKWVIGILVILNLALLGTIWYKFIIAPENETVFPLENEGRANKLPVNKDKNLEAGKPDESFKRNQRLEYFLVQELDFSPQQVEQYQRLRQEHFIASQANRKAVNDLRRQLMDQLLEENADQKRVDELSSKIGKKIAGNEKAVFKHLKELMAVCNNEEQEAKYKLFLRQILNHLRPKDHLPPPPGKHPGDIGGTGNDGHGEQRPQMEPSMRGNGPPNEFQQTREGRRTPPGDRNGGMENRENNHSRNQELNHLIHSLGLTGSQVPRVTSILQTARQKLEKIRHSSEYSGHQERRQAAEKVFQWRNRQIESILNNEQIQLFRKLQNNRPQHREPPER